MRPWRYLIVNADDFGLSPGVNRGVVQAHERGIVTSASLMVRQPAAGAAAACARAHPALSVGLHLDLGEWRLAHGQWRPLYQRAALDDAQAVEAEIALQLEMFREMAGREPTHLDSHQHVHRREPVRSLLLAHARRLGVALRGLTPGIRYCGSFYGQDDTGQPHPAGITVQALLELLLALPAGATELGCHPAAAADMDSAYGQERLRECETLCDARVREQASREGVTLGSFQGLRLDDARIRPA